MEMIVPTLNEELSLWRKGYYVIGIDEVGRGAFAGPLVVSAVVFSPFFSLPESSVMLPKALREVRDSKLLLPKKRASLCAGIKLHALSLHTVEVSVHTINKIGIGKANQVGFRKAIQKVQGELPGKKLFVLADGFHAKYVRGIGLKNQKAIIKGDQKSVTIASASIIAKVYRDKLMCELPVKYKHYKFETHKGYGTFLHRTLLKEHGLSPMHRRAFCHNVYLTNDGKLSNN